MFKKLFLVFLPVLLINCSEEKPKELTSDLSLACVASGQIRAGSNSVLDRFQLNILNGVGPFDVGVSGANSFSLSSPSFSRDDFIVSLPATVTVLDRGRVGAVRASCSVATTSSTSYSVSLSRSPQSSDRIQLKASSSPSVADPFYVFYQSNSRLSIQQNGSDTAYLINTSASSHSTTVTVELHQKDSSGNPIEEILGSTTLSMTIEGIDPSSYNLQLTAQAQMSNKITVTASSSLDAVKDSSGKTVAHYQFSLDDSSNFSISQASTGGSVATITSSNPPDSVIVTVQLRQKQSDATLSSLLAQRQWIVPFASVPSATLVLRTIPSSGTAYVGNALTIQAQAVGLISPNYQFNFSASVYHSTPYYNYASNTVDVDVWSAVPVDVTATVTASSGGISATGSIAFRFQQDPWYGDLYCQMDPHVWSYPVGSTVPFYIRAVDYYGNLTNEPLEVYNVTASPSVIASFLPSSIPILVSFGWTPGIYTLHYYVRSAVRPWLTCGPLQDTIFTFYPY